MLGLDLGNVLVNLWKFWKQDRELQDWIKLILGTFYSGFIAFTGAAGVSLSSGAHFLIAVGVGLSACSLAVLGVLLRDPRARSLLLSVPQPVIDEFQKQQGETTIFPSEDSKK